MDYCFSDETDIKLIALFIIDSFKSPIPDYYINDIIMLQPVINYFDLREGIKALEDSELITYYIEDNVRFYSVTPKGIETLGYFSLRIPKTIRERILRSIRLKIKELKNSISIISDYSKVNEIEYNVTLGIKESNFDLFKVSIAVGDEIMAKKMCSSFRKNPQSLYSEILQILIKDEDAL